MIPAPMPLGPFLVEEGGRLTFRQPGSQPGFTFLWRNRCFAVRLLGEKLSCAVPVGRVPSSSAGGGRRDQAMELLRVLARNLPAGWRIALLPDHRVQLSATLAMDWPATAAALITPIYALLMRAAPVLDVIDEAGLS